MQRFYFAQVIGTGTGTDTFRPALADLADVVWGADDLRVTTTVATGGWMIVWADVTDAQHATINADARVVYLPIEDAAGVPLTPDHLVGEVDATRRQQIQTRLEARHVPMTGITLVDPIRRVIARIIRRIRIRRVLGSDDFAEGLDTLVSAIPNARRNRIMNALTARGFTPPLTTDTIREALRKLIVQDVPLLRNGWD